MRASIRAGLSFLGPYRYNPYLIFLIFFLVFFTRFIPLIGSFPLGHKRWISALVVALVSAIPALIYAAGSSLLNRYRRWSDKSLAFYILEISFFVFINFLILPGLISLLNRELDSHYQTLIKLQITTFPCVVIIVLLIFALLHRADREVNERLSGANSLVSQLKIDQKNLVEAEELVRQQASAFLHDHVQSDLMVIALELKGSLNRPKGEVESIISRSIQSLEKIRSVDVRNLVQLLSPNFEVDGLKGSLNFLALQYRPSMAVELMVDDAAQALNDQVRLGIYRIVEQSLLNALLHGPAKRVLVTLSIADPSVIRLEVSDDGPGLALDSGSVGVGTAIIDSWVGILNGLKEIDSAPGHGYRLQVTIPK